MRFSDASVHASAGETTKTQEIEQPVIALVKPAQQQPSRRVVRSVRVKENYWDMVADYERHLRATNHAANTLQAYSRAFAAFAEYLTREGIGLHIEGIQREHVQGYMLHMLEERRMAPRSAKLDYAALHALFNWLVDEDEIDASPMRRMQAPKALKAPPEYISDAHLTRLLAACAGRDFLDRRDAAMIRVLLDTGLRRSGLCDMEVGRLDLDSASCRITSKRHTWTVGFSPSTVDALAAYLRARKRHLRADLPALWLTQQGALNVRSVNGIIDRRCVRAQIPRINPHRFRHTFAHVWLADGGQEGDLAELGGWNGTRMIHEVYARGLVNDRALAAHKNRRLGDRV